MRRLINVAICALHVLSGSDLALADAPNLKTNSVTYSENKQIKVISQTTGRTFAVNKENKKLWEINTYVKYSYVSNDGEYFAALYGGGNLIPIEYDGNLVLVTLFRNGKSIREIKIGDVISNKAQMELTSSHYYWGDAMGFVGSKRFDIKRADGRIFSFALTAS